MYFNSDNLIIKLYPERIYFNESMLNALLKYSLNEVMESEIIHRNKIDFDNCPQNLELVLKTKWGRAKINKGGYYVITSGKEGNNMKLLHRLIWEEYYGPIPEGFDVHHKDENTANNDISNLELISHPKHASHHKKDKPLSEEHCQKISESMKDNKNGFNPYITIRKAKRKTCKQGFIWIAEPFNHERKKILSSVNLEKCIEKVEDFINDPNKNTLGYIDYEVIDN